MDFKNSDITIGPTITDLTGADAAVALEAAATLAIAMQAGNILPLTADGQLVLPAGVGLDDIKVVGRDLVIQMPDGTQMIVPDGAVFVPQIVVDGVAVPPLNIAALLIGQEPQPEAGRPQSSGGNFADPVGDIGDPFGLGDLLPPTALAFPEPEEREVIPELNDEEPTTIIITPDQPAGSVMATASVNEAALPARGSEPPGSNETSNAETTTGSIVFDAPDGLASITLNGVAITAVGQVFVTPLGRLTITSIASGNIGYSYTLTDNTTNPASNDVFAVVVTDSDGDTASANLTINIIDDAPTARNDTDTVPAANYSGQTGNVITGVGTTNGNAGADTQGADGAIVSGIRAGTAAGTFAGAGTTINGQYGTLTISANGNYTYARNAGTPGGVNDVFTYQITDGDGDTSTATLTISIADSPVTITSVPTTGAGTVVDEAGLPARGTEPPGSNAAAPSESTSGTINFTAPDGVASVQINGIVITGAGQVITTPAGTLLITGYNPATGTLAYTFTLTDNTSGDATSQVFTITVTDIDGDTDSRPFTVRIIDDVPTARNDSGTQATENASVTVNVIANDTQGADGVNLATGVAFVAGSLSGTGTLVYNANGTFTYTPAPGEQGVVTFNYTITDDDGDVSTATVTINLLPDSTPTLRIAGDQEVNESGLPARSGEPEGSDAGADSEIAAGTITVGTGGDSVASLVINGINVTAGGTVNTAIGTLVVTLSGGVYSYSYTLKDNTLAATSNDSFTVVLTDSDGDTASSNLVIAIIDDVPTARNDSGTQATENAPVTVNVITNDTVGADGVNLTTGVALVADSLSGTGALVYNNNGTFTYTPAPGEQGVVTFNYTITDGDGDVSTATVTINLLADSTPTLRVAGDQDVNESGLPARSGEPEGSDAGANSEIANGTITVATGGDSIASLVINGVNVTAGGTVNTAIGTLVVTLSGGVYSYSYTLKDNTLAATSSDTFNIVLTDSDGDTASSALVIAIIDDAPTAVADTDSIAAGNYGPATGNVITDSEGDGGKDVQGADGVTVTNVTGAGGSGAAGTAVNGLYGVLTINADGSYSYVRNAGSPGGVSDVFTYTITDGDGDASTTTLTIAIADSPVTLDLPVKGAAGTSVDEAGLPAGSNAASDSEKTSGTIAYSAADGPASVTIDGVAVTAVGQTFTGSFGTLKITSIANGVIGYEYLLTTNTSGDSTFDDFAVVVTDQDGDSSSGTLVIDIVDDVPTARADVDSVTEDDFSGDRESVSADGNVITGVGGSDANSTDGVADTKGADGASVTAVAFGAIAGTVGGSTAGAYGTLTLNADGSYTYVLNNFNPVIQGLDSDDSLTEVFTYTLTDGDGDTRTTTLTITINGSDDSITINGLNIQGPNLIVDDDDLPDGSDPAKEPLTQTGSFTINGVDGISSIKIEGVEAFVGQTFTTAYGTFTITSIVTNTNAGGDPTSITVNYSYTLNDNVPHPSGAGQNTITEVFDVDVTDTDGSTESGTVKVLIIDDVPTANDDSAGPVAENADITVNVIANDILGADGVNLATGVVLVSGSLTGTGTLVYNADGSFTYTPTAGEEGLVTFNYQITDGDGDSSIATVTIDLGNDSTPTLGATDAVVDEEALADGSNPASNAETATGTIAVTTGNDSIASLIIDGINVTGGGTVVGAYGTLTVTLTAGVYSYSYTLTDNTTDHPTNPTTGTSEGIFDDFDIVLTDSDGDVVTDTIIIDILDDGPTARDDTVNQDVENTVVTFDVFGNDTFGADGVDIDNNPGVAVTFTQPATGSVSYDPATGLFTFTPVPGQLGTVTYTYTIIDGDGDPSTATVTINLKTDSIPTVRVTDVTVNEDGLPARAGEPAGTSFGSNSHIGNGSFSITTGGDTLQKLEVRDALGNWIDVTAGGTVNGANGTLVVTVVAGVYSYTYTLTDNLENHPDFITLDADGISDAADPLPGEAFDVRVTDSDNSVSAIDTLNVTVLDDAPVAANDPPFIISEDMVGTIGGNIFANDSKGADGATLTSVTINGVTVAIAAVGTTAYANANGSYIFAADGSWTFDPNSNLNNANGVDASFSYVITDGDGDPATAIQGILITDGAVPTAGAAISLMMDDQNLSDGSTPGNPDFVEGMISFTAGSDALTSFVFGPGTGALAGGLTWNRVSDTVIEGWDGPVGTGTKIVILQLTAPASIGVGLTGSVTIRATLVNNYDSHPGINIDDLVALGAINVVAADQDGDSVSQSVTLSVSDDLPTVTISGPTTVVEGASTAGGTWARSFNADQPGGSIKVIVDGTEYDLGTTITTAKGSLVVNADGTWTFTAANNLDQDIAQSFGFSIKITDADNDFVVRPFAIDITDGAGPAVGAGFTLTLDDQNLADGTTPGNADFVSNTLTFTAGSDALTSFVFAAGTGALAGGLTWVRVSNTQIEGFDGLVKIVTLTLTVPASIAAGANGTVTVTATLHDNYDSHPTFTADDLAALGSINVIASDHDGDSVSQTVTLAVSDDVPSMLVSGPTTVVEGASTVGGTWSQTIGADQPGAVTKVLFGGIEYNLGTAINTGNGTLTVNVDGTWVFAANNNLDNDLNPSVTFTVKVTDADNDVAQDPHTITITDGTPAANAAPITLEVDEAALDTAGAKGSDPSLTTEVDSGPSLSFTAGSDALTSFVFSTNLSALVANLDGAGTDIFWSRSGDGQTITGRLGGVAGPIAITLTLSAPASIAAGATGSVTVTATLSDNLQHANALLAQIQSLGSILVEARDHDGDVATGQVTVTVKDDVPLANPDSDSVTEDGPTVANGNVLLGAGFGPLPDDVNITDGVPDTRGADGASVTAFSFGATNGVVGNAGGLAGAYGTLVLNADGTYTYTLNNGLAIVQSLSLGQTLTETYSYTVTDADGDPSVTTLVITINGADDGVTITGLGGNAEETVFENDLLDGSSPNTPALTQPGTFAVTAVDGLNNIVIGGVTVVSGGVLTATLTIDTPLGLLTITGFTPTLGAGGEVIGGTVSYSYLLQDNSTAHASGAGANGGVFDNFNVVVTDVDGSSNNAVLNVEIIDDVPFAALSVAGLSLSHDETLGTQGDAQDVAGPLAIFALVTNVGDDLDVIGTAPIGFARDAGALSSAGSVTGADGGTTVFGLALSAQGVNSNLETTNGDDIFLYLEDGIVVGRVGSQLGAAAFAIAVEADGSVSVVQYLSIRHPTGGASHDEAVFLATNAILATVTVTDGDNDISSVSLAIGDRISFQDDGPVAAAPKAASLTNATGQSGGNFLDADNDVDGNYGVDGGKVIFTAATITSLLGQSLTSGLVPLAYSISADGTVLTATKGIAGPTVFTIRLQPAGSPDQYVVDIALPVDAVQNVQFTGSSIDIVGGNAGWAGFVPANQGNGAGDVPVNDDSKDLLFTPMVNYISDTTVNTNATEAGIGNNFVDVGEGARLDFVQDLTGSPVSGGAGDYNAAAANRAHVFDQHYLVNGASALFTAIGSSSTVQMIARDDFDANLIVGDGAVDNITAVAITYNGETKLVTVNGPVTVGGHIFTVTFGVTDAQVSNVITNTRLAMFTDNGFSSAEFHNIAGDDFKIGSFGASRIVQQPVSFTVPVSITDNDGDTVTSGNLAITLNPVAPPAPLMGAADIALPGDAMMFSVDQELEQSSTSTAVATSRVSGTQMTAVETASPSSASLATTGKPVEQARNSTNVAATVVAASLVGLPAISDAVAAPAPDDARLAMLPDMETPSPDQGGLISDAGTGNLASQPETVTDAEFASSTGDTDSSLQAVDDNDLPTGLLAQPVSPISGALTGGADVVSLGDIVPAMAPMGGDAVLHNILDLAAAGLTAASNDNAVKPALEDVVNEAMPDTMVDRLVEAFEADVGTPAIGGDAGSDSSGYLVELINQSVSNSSDFATIHVDPFGSQFNDMATTNNG